MLRWPIRIKRQTANNNKNFIYCNSVSKRLKEAPAHQCSISPCGMTPGKDQEDANTERGNYLTAQEPGIKGSCLFIDSWTWVWRKGKSEELNGTEPKWRRCLYRGSPIKNPLNSGMWARNCQMTKLKQWCNKFDVLYSRETNPWIGSVDVRDIQTIRKS